MLVSIRGTGRFNYYGTIIYTAESPTFAKEFWDDATLEGWKCLFFLKDVKKISITKAAVAKVLGYDKNDRFQGLRRVLPERLADSATITDLIHAADRIARTTPAAAD